MKKYIFILIIVILMFVINIKYEANTYTYILNPKYMYNIDNFNKINDILEASEQPLFANPRNAAAGSLRQLVPKIAAKRNLDIFVFNIQQIQGKEISTHIEGLEFLKEQGFKTILDKKSYSSIEKAYERILEIGEERGNLYFDIDGAVIKVN
mgnify:CR=1 FL=1